MLTRTRIRLGIQAYLNSYTDDSTEKTDAELAYLYLGGDGATKSEMFKRGKKLTELYQDWERRLALQ